MNLFFLVASHKDTDSGMELLKRVEEVKPGLFSPLDDKDSGIDKAYLKEVLLYIFYAYSKDSPLVVVGASIGQSRERVREFVGLPDLLHGPVVQLRNTTVLKTVLAYLEYQGDRAWRHLMRKYDQYEMLSDQVMSDMLDEDGKVNTKQFVESSKQVDVMYADIEALEEKMKEQYAFIYDNFKKIEDEQPDSTRRVQSFKLENSGFVK